MRIYLRQFFFWKLFSFVFQPFFFEIFASLQEEGYQKLTHTHKFISASKNMQQLSYAPQIAYVN